MVNVRSKCSFKLDADFTRIILSLANLHWIMSFRTLRFIFIFKLHKLHLNCVHRCGANGSMRACHAVGPGSIPGRVRFPGWGFFRGYSSPVRQMSGNFRPPKVPEYHLAVVFIIPYSPCWDDWVCDWCVLSFIFVLSRWPRHRADHSSGEALHVLVWSKKCVCEP